MRRELEEAKNRGGMSAGLPRVALFVSDLEWLLDRLDALEYRVSKLDK